MTPIKIAFLSCDNLDGYITDDNLALQPLKEAGFLVETKPWNTRCDWSQYQAVVVRTTWDYTQRLGEFLVALEHISSQTQLINDLSVIQWNSQKTYLKDLNSWGLRIIPTEYSWPNDWRSLFEKWQTETLMVKPQVGASSINTFKVTRESLPTKPLFSLGPLIQPFREKILTEGEFSFHFFYGEFSHAIQKVPKSGDYRVQEEYGGNIISITPSPEDLELATTIYKTVEGKLKTPTLFHRVDLVRNSSWELEIMELELVEPSLYFRTTPVAAPNFTKALKRLLAR
jgi:hypothetical protein